MGGVASVPVAIALGSNLGDRDAFLDRATSGLATLLDDLVASRRYETASVDGPADAPPFLNQVIIGRTTLTPRALLDALLALESSEGRERPFRNAPRTLDLDIVLYGGRVVDEPGLQVPHPRFRERAFVLEPLAEVAGDWLDPVTGQTMAALWQAWRDAAAVTTPAPTTVAPDA